MTSPQPLPSEAHSDGLRQIGRKSLKDMAVDQILSAISRDELKSGTVVTEMGLAKKLGISQVTVREALLELEHRGFVERPGPRKTRIANLTARQIRDIYLVRTRLELLAIEQLLSAPRPDLSEIEEMHRRLVAAAQAGDTGALFDADVGFHRALWRASGNESLVDIYERLIPKLFAFAVIKRAQLSAQDLREQAEEHGKLLELIRAGDVPAALAFAEASMQRAWRDDARLSEEQG